MCCFEADGLEKASPCTGKLSLWCSLPAVATHNVALVLSGLLQAWRHLFCHCMLVELNVSYVALSLGILKEELGWPLREGTVSSPSDKERENSGAHIRHPSMCGNVKDTSGSVLLALPFQDTVRIRVVSDFPLSLFVARESRNSFPPSVILEW